MIYHDDDPPPRREQPCGKMANVTHRLSDQDRALIRAELCRKQWLDRHDGQERVEAHTVNFLSLCLHPSEVGLRGGTEAAETPGQARRRQRDVVIAAAWICGLSERYIASALQMSRARVGAILARFRPPPG